MSRNRFVAKRLTPTQAHEVWARSDEASAFTRPDYLARLVDDVEWWGVERSGEAVAAWPLVRAFAGGEIGPPPFCYYVGPMFARSLREGKPYCRYWTGYTEVFTALLEAVVAEHDQFRCSLHPGLTDVRVLEWWNFDHPDRPGFRVAPRYTARIDQFAFPDPAALRRSFASTRQRDLDRWTFDPPEIVRDVNAERLVELHDEALRRGGGVVDRQRHSAFLRSIALVQSGAGSVLGLIPPGESKIEAATVLLEGPTESNCIFYAASDVWRPRGLTAWAVWQGLMHSRSQGKRWFDFNGANSPGRAADKHFYSAVTAIYFDCRFGPASPTRRDADA